MMIIIITEYSCYDYYTITIFLRFITITYYYYNYYYYYYRHYSIDIKYIEGFKRILFFLRMRYAYFYSMIKVSL